MLYIWGILTCLVFFSICWIIYHIGTRNVDEYEKGYGKNDEVQKTTRAYRLKQLFKGLGDFSGGVLIVSVIIGIFFAVMLVINTGINYGDQIESFEMLEEQQNVIGLYESKSQHISNQFVKYLTAYPEFEAGIYDKISPENIDIYMVKYPELKSSETVIALVDNIHVLQTEVYDAKIKIEKIKRDIRYRQVSAWNVNFVIPGLKDRKDSD